MVVLAQWYRIVHLSFEHIFILKYKFKFPNLCWVSYKYQEFCWIHNSAELHKLFLPFLARFSLMILFKNVVKHKERAE